MAREDLRKKIDLLEETYEFLLAYAARGKTGEGEAATELRKYLTGAAEVAEALPGLFRETVEELEPESPERYEAFARVLEGDAESTRAALRLVEAQPAIGSQLVDNLNASIHFRALLTDLFVIDEILSPRKVGAPST